VSGRQPAEHLAEIKRTFPLWSVRPVVGGVGWTGHRGTRRVWAATLDGLGAELRTAERSMSSDPRKTLGRLRSQHPRWTICTVPAGWSAEYREGTRLHYVICPSADELADALSRTEP
jgi:hypothetical protein